MQLYAGPSERFLEDAFVGFEFDYVGVIFGTDLRFDADIDDWVGDKRSSFDSVVKRSGDTFTALVKHTYRVLLTRGMKGCRVFFEDEGMRRRFVEAIRSEA